MTDLTSPELAGRGLAGRELAGPESARAARAATNPVVTGIGVVAPSGIGADAHWRSTLRGDLRVAPIRRFDASGYATALAGEVDGFQAEDHLDHRLLVQTDRWTWLGLAATQLAMDDAGYDPAAADPYDTSVVFASGSGGNDFGQREIQRLWSRGRQAVSVYQSIAWFYAATTGQASIRHGLKGPSGVVVADAAGGLESLAQARRTIRRGTPAVIAGGAEAGLTPYGLTCQISSGRLTASRDPSHGYKPFDRAANGYAPGEGAATLLVEDPAAAAARGAPPAYAEVLGYAATHDGAVTRDRPANPNRPENPNRPATPNRPENPGGPVARDGADGRWLAAAMRGALADAGLAPDDVDVVFADGAGSPDLDAAEARAIHLVFGARAGQVPVTAPQGYIGRLCAGGSALSCVTAVLAMRHGVIPAVGNLDEPAPGYDLDLVRAPRPADVRVAMVNARGYGGFNSSLILRAVRAAG